VLSRRFHELSLKVSLELESLIFILQSEKLIDLSEWNRLIRLFRMSMTSHLEFDDPISFPLIIKYSIGLILK
jgi:hypothetical protein